MTTSALRRTYGTTARAVLALGILVFARVLAAADVLLVDDDADLPNVRASYTQALDTLLVSYDVRDVSTDGEPDAATLQNYAAVIWFTGRPVRGPTATGEQALATYLDGGGCFVLSSQQYLWSRDPGAVSGQFATQLSQFTQSYLGVSAAIHDSQQTTVAGSTPFAGLGPYTLDYSVLNYNNLPNNNFSDVVGADATTVVAFTGNSGGPAGVAKDSGAFRTTFWAFPFEALPTADDRNAVMRRTLEKCQVPDLMRKMYRFERLWPTLQQPWYFASPFDAAVDLDGFVFVLDHLNHRVIKYTHQGQFVTRWGEAGLDEGQMVGPKGIAVTDDGSVYVADTSNNRIQRFSSAGAFELTWGSSGSGQDQFTDPVRIAADDRGLIYVVDGGNNRIQVFSGSGDFIRQLGSVGSGAGQLNFTRPSSMSGIKSGGVAIDRDGFVYVADIGNHRVQKFKPDGQFDSQWGTLGNGDGEFNEPADVAIAGDSVFVLDRQNKRVQQFTTAGTFVRKWGSFGGRPGEFADPLGLTTDAEGRVYVLDFLNRIEKFEPNGDFLFQWGSTGSSASQFNSTQRIASDATGSVYVVDRFNHRIEKFSADGQFLLEWGSQGSADGQFLSPGGVAVDGAGIVYVVETGGHRVQKFDANGGFMGKWGSEGSGNGQFQGPVAITTDANNDVYVVDQGNNWIQKFNSVGTFITGWGSVGMGDGQFQQASDIAVDSSGFVYVSDAFLSRVQKFTPAGVFVSKWGDPGLAEGQLSFPQGLFIDDNDLVYVAEGITGRFQVFSVNGKFIQVIGAKGSALGQFSHASDAVVLPDGRLVSTDEGNNRVQIFNNVQFAADTKAIVVVGGGDFPGNNLWDATKAMANTAYRALLYQGFSRDKIFYLSEEPNRDIDGNGVKDDIDGDATSAGLQNAITTWAAAGQTQDVIVYLTDHGGASNFRVSRTETISPTQLDGWLDTLETAISGRVILIYDACHSGSFTSATSAKNRVVITSTKADELAYFTGQGALSFSTYFWNQVLNGASVLTAFQRAHEALTMSPIANSPLQTPQIANDADGDGTPNQPSDIAMLNTIVIGSGTTNAGSAPLIGMITGPQDVPDGSSSASITVTGVMDSDGIGRVRAVLKPPDFAPGASDNPITGLPSFDLVQSSPGSGTFQATYTGFTTPGIYEVRVYAEDKLGNASPPKTTTVTVGNNPLTRRALLVAGGDQSDPLWMSIQEAAKSAYQALRFQGYKNSEIAFYSASTINGVEQLATLSNIEFALAPNQHGDSLDVMVYLVGDITGDAFRVNATQSMTSGTLDNWLDSLQAVLPGKLTVLVDGPASGTYVSRMEAPAGGESNRIRISSTTGPGPSLFPLNGTVSFSRFFWQQVTDGASLRNAFINARDNMSLLSARAQRARLDADGDGDSDAVDLSLVKAFSIGPGVLSAGDAPHIEPVTDAQILSTGTTTATIFVDNVTTTGTIQRVFAVVTPPVAKAVAPNPTTVDLMSVGGGRYEASHGGFGPTAGEYPVSRFTTDVDGVVSLPVKTTVKQLVGPDAYEPDNQAADASVIVPNNVTAQFHTIHQAGDVDWVRFYGAGGLTYMIKVSNVGPNADPVIELYRADAMTLIDSQNLKPAGMPETLSFSEPSSGVFFVKIRDLNPAAGGVGSHYDLNVDDSAANNPGTINGLVSSDVQVANLAGAVVTAGMNAGAITLGDGSFEVNLNQGTVDVTVSADGYQPATVNDVQVVSNSQTEVSVKLTPKDDDADGLPDPWELENFGNLNQIPTGDFDNDGMPNSFEFQQGFDPKVNDAGQDADGDGFSNVNEFRRGTNPNDASSFPSGLPWLPILLFE